MRSWLPAASAILLTSVAIPAAAQDELAALTFMAGCWQGPLGPGEEGTIEERWSPPAGGLMLGTTRYMREGRAFMFEFTVVRADSLGVVMLPHPRGVASEHGFAMTRSGPAEAVFEAPQHDFPKRILYRRQGADLFVRVDGGEEGGEASEYTMSPITCRPDEE